jgi:hypothetical protein
VVEDPKTAIFVRGNSTSENVRLAMKELVSGLGDINGRKLRTSMPKTGKVMSTAILTPI